MRFCDSNFKSGQVNFTQRAFVHDRIAGHAAQLLGIGRKVLRTGTDAFGLDAAHVAGCHFAGKVRIFAEIFEITSAKRAALDVQPRAEQHAYVLGCGFRAQMGTDFFSECRVPAVAYRRCGRIAGRWQAAV